MSEDDDPYSGATTGNAGSAGRDLRRIVSSVTISALGTWSYNVGIAVYAFQETQSTTWVALATVGRYLPALFITAIGSRWADRYPRRTVATVSDGVCALIMVALTVVAVTHAPLVLAILLAAVSSGVARIQSSAALSVAADLVVESELARAAVLITTSEAIATALGPALASLVLAFSTPAVLFALNGVTFAVSAILLLGVRSVPVRQTGGDAGSPTVSASAEETYRATLRVVWPLLVTRTLAAVVYGADVVLLAVIATEQLNQGTSGYGWLLAAAGLGGLLAAALMRRKDNLVRRALTSALGLVLYCLPLLVFLGAPALGGGLATQVVRGLGCVLVTTTVIAGLQHAVPTLASNRMFGLTHVLVLVGTSTGALLAPLLLHLWGLNSALVVIAVVPVLLQLAALPALMRFDRDGASALAALDPRVDLLRRLTLFRDSTRMTLYDLADRAREMTAQASVPIVVEGDVADALWVLVEGTVEVTMHGEDGPQVLRQMSAPAYFGEIGLLHGVRRTATVTATSESTLWRIPAETFLDAVMAAGLSNALNDNVRLRVGTGHGDGRGLTLSDV